MHIRLFFFFMIEDTTTRTTDLHQSSSGDVRVPEEIGGETSAVLSVTVDVRIVHQCTFFGKKIGNGPFF